jgi:hypothetical protein
MWRLAGAFCIAHVVLLLAGYSQMASPAFGAPPAAVVNVYAGVPASRMYLGGFVAVVAWLVLLVAVTVIGRLLRGTSDVSGSFAGLVVSAGIAATVVTLAGAFVTAGGAYVAATHGYAPDVVAGISSVSKFADLVAMAASGVCALAVGVAGLTSRALPRWVSWLSVVVGVVGVASGAGTGVLDIGTLAWFGWLVVLVS